MKSKFDIKKIKDQSETENMRLFNKVLAVLVSMNFLFLSIAFGTGTSRLEPFYLNIVAQYMPMKDKITLEQVNKNCAESLKMGYADNFLKCYALLKNVENNKGPKVDSYKDYKLIHQAFSSGGKILVLTQDITKLDYFENNFSDFKCLVKRVVFFHDNVHDSRYVVFLPRSYNFTKETEEKYKDINPSDLLLKLIKLEQWVHSNNYVLPEKKDLCTGKSVLCMRCYFNLNKIEIIGSCSDNDVTHLADMYYMPGLYLLTDTDIRYSSDSRRVYIDPMRCDLYSFKEDLENYVYSRVSELLEYGIWDKAQLGTFQKRFDKLLEILDHCIRSNHESANQTVLEIRKLISDLGKPIIGLYDRYPESQEQFANDQQLYHSESIILDFLPPDISCLTNFFLNTYYAYDYFFLVPWPKYDEFKNAFEKLDYYKNPANRIIRNKPLICLPKFDKDELLSNFLRQLRGSDIYEIRSCVCTAAPNYEPGTGLEKINRQYTLFSEGKLKSTIYLLSKAKCSFEQFEIIGDKILNTISDITNDDTKALARKILDDAKNLRGEFNDLDPWSREPIGQSSGRSPARKSDTKFKQVETSTNPGQLLQNSDISTSSTGLFQNITKVLLGTASLGFVGALAYKGVKKYKNTSETKNISKQKNNKNINKSCCIQ